MKNTGKKLKLKEFEDIANLYFNYKHSSLNFDDFPESIRNDKLFIYEYFSNLEVNEKYYKYIPKELLSSPLFINACLVKNPDLYLLADKSCHSNYAYNKLKEILPNSYLKYAKEEELKDDSFCLKLVNEKNLNYRYLPDHLKLNKNLIIRIITKEKFGKNLQNLFNSMPKEFKEDKDLIEILINKNALLFPYIPSKFRDDDEIAFKSVFKDSSNMVSVSERLKNDASFINKVINENKKIRDWDYHSVVFTIQDIFENISIDLFSEEFCKNNSTDIRACFVNLKSSHRSNRNIIKTLYNKDSNEKISFDTGFLNKINDIQLQKILKTVKNNANYSYNSDPLKLSYDFSKAIDMYYLQKDLELNLKSGNNTKVEKLKI